MADQETLAGVSVIIPAYQSVGTIGRALESVAAQTVTPRRVIVVDDGSGDGTAEAARAHNGKLGGSELIVIEQANKGAGAARNRALAEAETEYVAFLDADDEWLADKLERSLHYLKQGDLVLVAHNGWIVDEGKERLNDCARRFEEGEDPFTGLYRKGFIDTSTVVARRRAIIAAGGFDERLPNAQDFELWLALTGHQDAKFLVFDETLSRAHVTPGSIMSHTDRRLTCCMEVAVRYARDLKGRPGGMFTNLWYRIAAVHKEAISAHRQAGRRLGVIKTAAIMPFAFLAATLMALAEKGAPKEDFLKERGG